MKGMRTSITGRATLVFILINLGIIGLFGIALFQKPDVSTASPPAGTQVLPGYMPVAAISAKPQECKPGKVLICHIPPGNPENPQSICVAESAVPAHLAHGDYLGACIEPTPTPVPTTPPAPTQTPSTSPGPTLERNVDVIAPSGQKGVLGETLFYTFIVKNQGYLQDTYQLTLYSEENTAIGNIPAEISLSPGAASDISTFITLPSAGDFSSVLLTLEAVSTTDGSIRDSDTVITQIATQIPPEEGSTQNRNRTFAAEIQGQVFWDQNENGVRDAREPGLAGIEMLLIRNLARQISDEHGDFLFAGLTPGEQAVSLDVTKLPPGHRLTTESTVLLTLSEGGIGYVEFGIQSEFTQIVALVYHDANQNRRHDTGEPGIGGVEIEIDRTARFETDQQGMLKSSFLSAGKHIIALMPQTLPARYQVAASREVVGETEILLRAGKSQIVEFGVMLKPGVIHGKIFLDRNKNHMQDSGEPGVPDVVLEVSGPQSLRGMSNAQGDIVFDPVEPGAYILTLLPSSFPKKHHSTALLSQFTLVNPGEDHTILWGLAPIFPDSPE